MHLNVHSNLLLGGMHIHYGLFHELIFFSLGYTYEIYILR